MVLPVSRAKNGISGHQGFVAPAFHQVACIVQGSPAINFDKSSVSFAWQSVSCKWVMLLQSAFNEALTPQSRD